MSKIKRFQPPTLEQCEAYKAEKGYKYVDSTEFLLYYKMCGWVVGKSRKPMKCWHSAMALWESKEKKKRGISARVSKYGGEIANE